MLASKTAIYSSCLTTSIVVFTEHVAFDIHGVFAIGVNVPEDPGQLKGQLKLQLLLLAYLHGSHCHMVCCPGTECETSPHTVASSSGHSEYPPHLDMTFPSRGCKAALRSL